MSDMYFKSLPDTSTPLIPINLDKLNDIKVSPTEPTTSEKVWVQKGKNLYNGSLTIGSITDTGVEQVSDNSARSNNYFKVEANKNYIVSYDTSVSGTALNVVTFYDENRTFLSRITGVGKNTFVTPANCKYLRLTFYNSSGISISALSNIQLEQGTTATSYEAYVEPKIYVKNDNGAYEEFYKKNDLQTNMRTIWKGNCYTTGSANTQITSENFEEGKLYLFVVQGNSGAFRMTIPYVYGSGNSLQYAYYDGTTVVRWRIIINTTRTGFYLDNDSLNMGSNTGVLAIYKVE